MGRTCRICQRSRPNEQFGGKGLRAVICSKCRQRPKVEQQRILATDEVHGFLQQSNISAKNIQRLAELASLDDAAFARLRILVLEIATVQPRKRKRWKRLRQDHAELYERITDSGLFDYLLDEEECRLGLVDDDGCDDESLAWEDVWLENEEP